MSVKEMIIAMQTLLFVLSGVSLLIGIGLMTNGQQYGMLFILFTLSVALYIDRKHNKENV
ncbi:MAG: hypothetical protein L0J63_11050 [Tetragenococcus koreensis]|nr:hypothetical protein [Tetragenococcus koreensis]